MVNQERTNKSAESVKKIRELIEDDFKKNPDMFDEIDYKRVMQDDWYVKRFLLIQKRNVDGGHKALRNALIWRKDMKLNSIKDYDFPVELYQSNILFPYETDKEGHPVIYLRVCKYRKIPEMESILQKFIIHLLDKFDRLTNGNGIGMVFDLTNATSSNIDWTFLKYFTDTGTNYFPYSIKYVLIYNLPWYLNAIQRVALSVLPKDNVGIIKFAKGSALYDFIEREKLPDFLGGTCLRSYRSIPEGSPSLEKVLNEEGLPQESINKIVSLYKEMSLLEPGTENINYIEPLDFFDKPEKESEEEENEDSGLEMNGVYLLTEPEDILLFSNLVGENQLTSELILRNTSDKTIAYKIMSNSPLNYRVSSCFGLILPHSAVKVVIMRVIGLNDIVKSKTVDKILVRSLPVNKTSMTGDEFYNLWNHQREAIDSCILMCKVTATKSKSCPSMNGYAAKTPEGDIQKQVKLLKKKYKSIESQQNKTSLIFSITIIFFAILLSYFFAAYSDLKPVKYLRNTTSHTSDQ